MGFKKFFRHEKDNKETHEKQNEIERVKNEIEEEDRIFQQELQSKDKLLERFEVEQLKLFCKEMLGREPEPEYYEERETGKQIELPLYKEDYKHFIIDEMRLSQINDYALKNKIVPKNFFKI